MAVAVGHQANKMNAGSGVSSTSWSHDCTGDNLLLVLCAFANGDRTPTVTFNGVALTEIAHVQSSATIMIHVLALVNPDQGNYTIAVNWGTNQSNGFQSVSFSGANGGYDTPVTAVHATDTTPYTMTLNDTIDTGDLLVALFGGDYGNTTGESVNGTSLFLTANSNGYLEVAGNYTTTSGSQNLTYTRTTTSAGNYFVGAAIRILGTSPTSIKKVAGVAYASIKKIGGVAIASVKKVGGLS